MGNLGLPQPEELAGQDTTLQGPVRSFKGYWPFGEWYPDLPDLEKLSVEYLANQTDVRNYEDTVSRCPRAAERCFSKAAWVWSGGAEHQKLRNCVVSRLITVEVRGPSQLPT